ncbi:Uncharacterised protein [Mycobacteroides abscessus subsp. massiliense]|uniref:antitoxin VbhA family protein n=1 Tax=Mycobacteroides abscessus TaxID=36809 RepID=UPI0009A84654|nr:antitoxin VbhA family protein [Mycobacteroides abscessus]SKK90456.1 Uncharacterised protein [Mycobacteroides abscessus subsp. massiliense]
MGREIADDKPDSLALLAKLLHGSDLSATQQRAVYDAIADSMIEGATPDREFILRLIELVAGRITFDQFKTQVLQAHTSAIDSVGQELRDRHRLFDSQPAHSTPKPHG